MSSKIKNKYSIWAFWWIKFIHDVLYYRKTYVRKTSNIQLSAESPCVIVSNHQNSLNDAMAIIMSMKRHKIWFLARADIFNNKIFQRLLNILGVLPVYRQRDGFANLKNNFQTFDIAENYLLNGCFICLFPEAKHQDRHYLGTFFLSYTRMAFNAAAATNFSKEVFILPCANHYTDYFNIQSDILINYGEPISLKPYYELYRNNPRLAQEQVNEIVHQKVDELMLNIQDKENYNAIYHLLNNVGNDYAISQHVKTDNLPQKLKIDKKIVHQLENVKHTQPDLFDNICQTSEHYTALLNQYQLTDQCVAKPYSTLKMIGTLMGLLATIGIFIVGFIHHVIPYFIPKIASRKIKDPLLRPSFDLALHAIATIPVFYLLYIITVSIIFHNWGITLIYMLLLPFCGIFAWWWLQYLKTFVKMTKSRHFKWFKPTIWEKLQSTRLALKKLLCQVMGSTF